MARRLAGAVGLLIVIYAARAAMGVQKVMRTGKGQNFFNALSRWVFYATLALLAAAFVRQANAGVLDDIRETRASCEASQASSEAAAAEGTQCSRAAAAALMRIEARLDRLEAAMIDLAGAVTETCPDPVVCPECPACPPPPDPGPDLSEYRVAMDALIAKHAGTWRTLADRYPAAANGYSDPVRAAIDGLWMLAKATREPSYAELAVELTQRVIAASKTVPRHFTSDTRMFAGFRDVAATARELGVDPGGIEASVAEMLRLYEGKNYCCVGGAFVPFKEWALKQHLDPLSLASPFAGGVQGQAMDGARMAPPGDPWREAVLDALAVAEASGTYAGGWNEGYAYRSTFKAFGDVAAQVLTGRPAPPVWSQVYDGTRFAEFVDGTSRPGFHGASQLYEGACLLPEARALCRQAIAGTLTGTMDELNRSTNGTREAAAIGATALGEVL